MQSAAMIERTILPKVERDVAEVVACADCSRVAALRQVAKLIEADSQVTVLTTKRERSVCHRVRNDLVGQKCEIIKSKREGLTGVASAPSINLDMVVSCAFDSSGYLSRIFRINKCDGLPAEAERGGSSVNEFARSYRSFEHTGD